MSALVSDAFSADDDLSSGKRRMEVMQVLMEQQEPLFVTEDCQFGPCIGGGGDDLYDVGSKARGGVSADAGAAGQ